VLQLGKQFVSEYWDMLVLNLNIEINSNESIPAQQFLRVPEGGCRHWHGKFHCGVAGKVCRGEIISDLVELSDS
jgi:hypothetical protein